MKHYWTSPFEEQPKFVRSFWSNDWPRQWQVVLSMRSGTLQIPQLKPLHSATHIPNHRVTNQLIQLWMVRYDVEQRLLQGVIYACIRPNDDDPKHKPFHLAWCKADPAPSLSCVLLRTNHRKTSPPYVCLAWHLN
jgi:hypothetical protein